MRILHQQRIIDCKALYRSYCLIQGPGKILMSNPASKRCSQIGLEQDVIQLVHCDTIQDYLVIEAVQGVTAKIPFGETTPLDTCQYDRGKWYQGIICT